MHKITKWQWRTGLWLTIGIGLLSTLTNLATDMNWKQWLAATGGTLATAITGYLAKSPIDDVQEVADVPPVETPPQ